MALILDGLTKTFSSFPAVNNLSYTMDTGVYGLLGVNGAGKTTLMRMLCTLLTPTSGTITWDGQDIFSLGSAYRNLLGYLPQDFGYYPDFSVQDYLLYIASIKGLRPATARQRMQSLLEQVGLTQVRRQKMKKLSGGMKRRAGIAQAMLNDPKILILDEPTAGLDPKERIRFRNLISELAENRLVLLSTHIVSDVEYIADQILLMKDGSLVHHGTSQQLLAAAPTQVWTCTVPRAQADQLLHQYPVVNLKTLPQGVQLRVLSQTPPTPEAHPAEMSLEDLFLHYFGETAGETDAAL
ncbi:ABC transporter ATP-binding protein [Evtepia gabavorous]|uniref:ABC transporter ATP-binding protein n=1 Tax=Evtepia gabavorous TaxID=2211183 RepID=UPI003AAE9CB0